MTGKRVDEIELDHEGRIARLEEAIKQVCENHIPHMRDDIKEIQLWIRGIAIAIALSIIGAILNHFIGV